MPPRAKLFTEEMETRLVFEVQKRPILWDVSLDAYRRTDLKPPVWDAVAEALGPQYSGTVAATRFKNIKDTFMQNVRKVRESHRSGVGTTDIYKPRWHLWLLCQFLLKTCDQAVSTSNIPITTENSMVQFEVLNCTQDEVHNTVPVYYDDNLKKFLCIPADPSPTASDVDDVNGTSGSWPESPALDIRGSSSGSGPSSPDTFVIPRPASAPVQVASCSSKIDSRTGPYSCTQTTSMYDSKGSSKKRTYETMKETLNVVQEIARQPLFPANFFYPPKDTAAATNDDYYLFGKFVASRLRRMGKVQASQCEKKLMEVLMGF